MTTGFFLCKGIIHQCICEVTSIFFVAVVRAENLVAYCGSVVCGGPGWRAFVGGARFGAWRPAFLLGSRSWVPVRQCRKVLAFIVGRPPLVRRENLLASLTRIHVSQNEHWSLLH